MRNYYKIPLIFLLLASLLGLFLRWQFLTPTSGIRYSFFLHSHSHVMFLGWVFNVLYLSLLEHNVSSHYHKRLLRIFFLLQTLVVAMMISFPMQGYGVFSIVFSTLHTIAPLVLVPLFLIHTKRDLRVSTWFARTASVFFFISAAGPFSLGYLMANGLGQTNWYNYSVYFYLHFQYNGFFLFAIFSLYFQLLEEKKISFSYSTAKTFGKWMAIACVPAYTLSTLFARPGLTFNLIGAAAAVTQIVALTIFLADGRKMKQALRFNFSSLTYKVFRLALCALIIKCLLQLVSAHQNVADLAYYMRPVVIAYLHLVLVGIITIFLLVWYVEKKLASLSMASLSMCLLLVGFIDSQVCLVLSPWWSLVAGDAVHPALLIFVFSALMVLAFALFCLSFIRSKVRPHQEALSGSTNHRQDLTAS